MPVTVFACPPDKKKFGEVHDPEYCVTRCDEQCYSPFLMTAIYGLNARNYHKGRYVSATALSGCKRRLTLERTVDYADYYQNLYAGFRGTITHTVVEEALETKFASGRSLESLGFIAEWNMVVGFCLRDKTHGAFEIDPDADPDDLATYAKLSCPRCEAEGIQPRDQTTIILGGTLDGGAPLFLDSGGDAPEDEYTIIVDKDGTAYYRLSDLKTMKEYALNKFVKGDPDNTLHPQIKDDYVRQARVYTYLASRARVPDRLAKRGIKRIKMVRSDIQGFAMGEAPWTGGGTYRWKDHYKNPLKDWPMYEIDLGSEQWVEDYIFTEAQPILRSLILGQERGSVRKEEHAWLCEGYCAFYGTDFCPNPSLEAALIAQGVDAEEAFNRASERTVLSIPKAVAQIEAKDTETIDNFFRRKQGLPLVQIEKAPKKRAPRKKKSA
jgi:hypothetical protein